MKALSLLVGSVAVRQKEQLYCLNDLHKAAGGEAKHQPALFLRNDQVKELIEELSSTDSQSLILKTVLGKGKAQGTYACKELVYAYAMWISPKFHLHVIRAYDALVMDSNHRAALADEYRPMADALKRVRSEIGKETQYFHYSNEADMLNKVLTGLRCRDFKARYQCDSIRDNLTVYGREALLSLQRANTAMIEMGHDHALRKEQLSKLLELRWSKQPLIDQTVMLFPQSADARESAA